MITMKMISRELVEADLNGYTFTMPICQLGTSELHIIGFDSMGRTRLIHEVAKALLQVADFRKVDYIVCPEAKAIPVAQEMSRLLGVNYFVLRKAKKAYMKKPEYIEVRSITTEGIQTLWYDSQEIEDSLKGKSVMLFDDVVSTGASYKALEEFAEKNSLNVVGKCAVFSEGDAKVRKDIKVLGHLPLLVKSDLDKQFEVE